MKVTARRVGGGDYSREAINRGAGLFEEIR